MKTLTVMTAAALVLWAFPVWAESSLPAEEERHIYEWYDSEGVLHFSDIGNGTSGEISGAAETHAPPVRKKSPPPVSQDLVRQGYLARSLVEALDMGVAEDEADAEGVLASAGIVPEEGWIADYPVTPDIAAELRTAIADAANRGDIRMEAAEALAAFENLLDRYGLPARDGSGYASTEEVPDSYVERYTVEQYYYDYGPPVITYYPPPYRYLGLYVWVPFRFWWHDFYFTGYYILSDFHIVVGLNHRHSGRHFRVIHDDPRGKDYLRSGRRVVVSSHGFKRSHTEEGISTGRSSFYRGGSAIRGMTRNRVAPRAFEKGSLSRFEQPRIRDARIWKDKSSRNGREEFRGRFYGSSDRGYDRDWGRERGPRRNGSSGDWSRMFERSRGGHVGKSRGARNSGSWDNDFSGRERRGR